MQDRWDVGMSLEWGEIAYHLYYLSFFFHHRERQKRIL